MHGNALFKSIFIKFTADGLVDSEKKYCEHYTLGITWNLIVYVDAIYLRSSLRDFLLRNLPSDDAITQGQIRGIESPSYSFFGN